LPDEEQPRIRDDATVAPPLAGSPTQRLPVTTRRPQVYRPRSWLTFTVAALVAGVVTVAVIALVVALR
jgi:hypothetical protein